MQPRHVLTPPARELARRQAGVLSTTQLLDLGFTRRSLRRADDDWTRIAPGAYFLSDVPAEVPWEARVWAGVLLGGPGACAAGPTAALLQGLLTAAEVEQSSRYLPTVALRAREEIHILTRGRQVRSRPGYRFVADRHGTHLAPRAAEPPRTAVDDTVLDLCSEGPERDVATWVSRACQRRLTTERRLLARLAERRTVRHRQIIAAVLADVSAGATTELERRALRDVLAAHGLPPGRRQARTAARGRIVDLLFAEQALVVELDGKIGHVEEGRFRDRRRDNTHTVSGLWTLRYGWQEITGAPCTCALEIAGALWDRGWSGEFQPCRACPR